MPADEPQALICNGGEQVAGVQIVVTWHRLPADTQQSRAGADMLIYPPGMTRVSTALGNSWSFRWN